ncbi:MAG: hypothetical protein ABIG60_02495 [Patescibacteria group bacterium]
MKCYEFTWYGKKMRIDLGLGGSHLWLYGKKISVFGNVEYYNEKYFIRAAEPITIDGRCCLFSPKSREDKALVVWRVSLNQGKKFQFEFGDSQIFEKEQEQVSEEEIRFHILLAMKPGEPVKVFAGEKEVEKLLYKGNEVFYWVHNSPFYKFPIHSIVNRKQIFAAHEAFLRNRPGPCMEGWPMIP